MNKRQIDEQILTAYEGIKACGLLDEQNCIDKAWQSQISSFGAAVRNGSLLAAIAFFSEQGNSKNDRKKLMDCINFILEKQQKRYTSLIEKVSNTEVSKQEVLNAAVALKLAMNLYSMKRASEKEKIVHDSK